MASRAGMGLSKVVLLFGAGFTLPSVLRNGQLADILLGIQDMLDKSADKAGGHADCADAIAAQVHRLAMEVRQLATAHQLITVENGGNIGSLVIPAAALAGLGYGYMWWKGISFSDFMFVTRRNLTAAVSTMMGEIKHLVDHLVEAKKHLIERMGIFDWKLGQQKERIKDIKTQLTDTRGNFDEMNSKIQSIYRHVLGLDETCLSMEEKQKFICTGIFHLCKTLNSVNGVKDGPKAPRKLEPTCSKALQQISYNMKAILNDSDVSSNLKTLTRAYALDCSSVLWSNIDTLASQTKSHD